MNTVVVGLGKMGLPLAVRVALSGYETVGVDIDGDVVEAVNGRRVPFPGESGLEPALAAVRASGLFSASEDLGSAIRWADVVIVIVPVGVTNGEPDLAVLEGVAADIASNLRSGQLIILESTVPVGTTRKFGQAIGRTAGLTPGEQFYVAYSPERVSSGSIFRDLRAYPKLVGGIDEQSTNHAVDFYTRVLTFDARADLSRENGVWPLANAEEAELTKLAETTYRDINIALANEFAAYAETINASFDRVREAANSQPYSHLHRPGLVGGHCIPVYPHLYLASDTSARLPMLAREVNRSQVTRIVDELEGLVETLSGRSIGILGVTYRAGVKETSNSGALALARVIEDRGGVAMIHDPLFTDSELVELGVRPFRLEDGCDAIVLHTPHPEYRDLRPADLVGCQVALDLAGWIREELWKSTPLWRIGAGLVN